MAPGRLPEGARGPVDQVVVDLLREQVADGIPANARMPGRRMHQREELRVRDDLVVAPCLEEELRLRAADPEQGHGVAAPADDVRCAHAAVVAREDRSKLSAEREPDDAEARRIDVGPCRKGVEGASGCDDGRRVCLGCVRPRRGTTTYAGTPPIESLRIVAQLAVACTPSSVTFA